MCKGPDPRTEAFRSGHGIFGTHKSFRAKAQDAKMGVGGITSRGDDTHPFLQETSRASNVCEVQHLPLDGSSLEEKTNKIHTPRDYTYLVDVKLERICLMTLY